MPTVVLMTVLSGCRDEFPPGPYGTLPGTFTGSVWRLESIENLATGGLEMVDTSVAITIGFDDTSGFRSTTQCKFFGGTYSAGDTSMTLGDFWQTRIWCRAYNPAEPAYLSALDSVRSYRATATRLHLYYGNAMVLNFGKLPSSTNSPRIIFNRFDSSRSGQYTLTISSPTGGNGTSVDSSALLVSAPQNGRIAYTVTENGISRVIVSNLDGSERKELHTFSNPYGTGPETVVLSPDGVHVAFGVERTDLQLQTLMVVGTDGSGLVKISDQMAKGAAPTFSPDGKRIAFYSGDSTDYGGTGSYGEVSVSDVDGTMSPMVIASNARPVYGYVFGYERLEWSPDGSRIAFNGTLGYGASDIYVVNADGSGLTNLTNDGSAASWPTWSPDGSWIAYTSGTRIHRVRTDGTGGAEQLTPQSSVADELYPQWSPDGKQIMFITITKFVTSPGAYPGRLTMLNVESREMTTITDVAYKAFWVP